MAAEDYYNKFQANWSKFSEVSLLTDGQTDFQLYKIDFE